MPKSKMTKRTGAPRPTSARKQKKKNLGIKRVDRNVTRSIVSVDRRDMAAVGRMINDPCSAAVDINGFATTEGIGMRVFDTFSATGATSGDGYVIWFPQYCSNGAGSVSMTGTGFINMFAHYNSGAPSNTAATPAGSIAYSSYPDPAFAWGDTATVADVRTHAACLQARYIGTVSACSGIIGTLTNIPMDILTGSTFPSVDQLLQVSRDIRRIDFDTHEVKHRPGDANRFFDTNDGPFGFTVGSQRTTESTSGVPVAARGIGFVWKGAVAASLAFTRYKVIEWKPLAGSGIPAVPVSTNSVPVNIESMRVLDEQAEASGYDWSSMIIKAGRAAIDVFAPGHELPVRLLRSASVGSLRRGMQALTM